MIFPEPAQMDGLERPPDGDRDRGPIIMAVYWTTLSLASLTVSLRFYSRYHIHSIGSDDWMMLLSVALMAVLTVLGTILVLRGGCRHLYFLVLQGDGKGYLPITRMMHYTEPFSFMALAAGRISVALLILRIITTSIWRRRFLYTGIVVSLIANVLWSALWFARCPPNPGLSPPYYAGSCWNADIMFGITIFTAVWNVFMDFALAILPITLFWKLQLSPKKKISVCLLMSLGIFAAISGTIKTIKLDGINQVDFTWEEFDLYLWSAIESVLIVTCGSITTLKPIYDKLVKSGRNLKEVYLTYRRKRFTRSQVSPPSASEDKNLSVDSHGVQELIPVHDNVDRRRKADGLMEVGLWSSHGSEINTTLRSTNIDENERVPSEEGQSWPYGPDTSFLLV